MGRSIAESLWDRLPDDIQEIIQRFAEEAAFNANVKLIMERFGVSEESARDALEANDGDVASTIIDMTKSFRNLAACLKSTYRVMNVGTYAADPLAHYCMLAIARQYRIGVGSRTDVKDAKERAASRRAMEQAMFGGPQSHGRYERRRRAQNAQ